MRVLLGWRPTGVPFWLTALAAMLGAATVAVTVGVSVPCHRRLSAGYDDAVLDRLVHTNWYRTVAWSAGGSSPRSWCSWRPDAGGDRREARGSSRVRTR